MADLRGFDANVVEPSKDFEPVPAGRYLAVITASEMKPNKASRVTTSSSRSRFSRASTRAARCGRGSTSTTPTHGGADRGRRTVRRLSSGRGSHTRRLRRPAQPAALHHGEVQEAPTSDRVVNEISKYEKKEAATSGTPPSAQGSMPRGNARRDRTGVALPAVDQPLLAARGAQDAHQPRGAPVPRPRAGAPRGLAPRTARRVARRRGRGLPADRRRRDLDNTQKALLDALPARGCLRRRFPDRPLTLIRREPVADGKTIVRIRRL